MTALASHNAALNQPDSIIDSHKITLLNNKSKFIVSKYTLILVPHCTNQYKITYCLFDKSQPTIFNTGISPLQTQRNKDERFSFFFLRLEKTRIFYSKVPIEYS